MNDELLAQLKAALANDDGKLAAALQDELDGFEFAPSRQECVLIPSDEGGVVIFDIDEFAESLNCIGASLLGGNFAVLDRDTLEWRPVEKKKSAQLKSIKNKTP